MKKLLLPIFGGFLLTSSLSLTTGQNVDTAVKLQKKQETKTQEFLNLVYSINSKSNLTEEEITAVQLSSQNWDNEAIDNVLYQALEYRNNQLTIDLNKLDTSKLPKELLEHIDLALSNLNNAVAVGFINVNVRNNNKVELIYPNASSSLKNTSDDIIYFDSVNNKNQNSLMSASAYSSYMWYSTYGPSRWWKFWEWGGYLHFSETAVQNAKMINLVASIANIYFLLKNIKNLVKAIDKLEAAWNIGNNDKINNALEELSGIVGDIDLNLLGNIVDILAIFTAVISFGLALTSAGGWLAPLFELIVGIITSVTSRIINADRGYGAKWQFYNFIIPGSITAE